MSSILLSHGELHALMFTADLVFGIAPQSRLACDYLLPVKVVPLHLARKIIALCDELQRATPELLPPFTVHLYPTHGEVWQTIHWRQSTSKRYKEILESRARVDHLNQVREETSALHSCVTDVLSHLSRQGLNFGYGAAYLLAYHILNGTTPAATIIELELQQLITKHHVPSNGEQDRDTDTSAEDCASSEDEGTQDG